MPVKKDKKMKACLDRFKYPDGTEQYNGRGVTKGYLPLTLSYVDGGAALLVGPVRKTCKGARKIFEKLAGDLGYTVVWED